MQCCLFFSHLHKVNVPYIQYKDHNSATAGVALVEISPSVVAPICQAGDQLELRCYTSSNFLRWEFVAISASGEAVTYMQTVTSDGPAGVDSDPITINSTIMVSFSRDSSQGSLPLISRMTINPVSDGLNGVDVKCTDRVTSESATTTILIIGGRPQS